MRAAASGRVFVALVVEGKFRGQNVDTEGLSVSMCQLEVVYSRTYNMITGNRHSIVYAKRSN